MGREVILNNTQLDVMADDDLEISYENSLLQSISDFKMSYTNTYTLPLTAKNRAIFKAINDVNTDTGIARKYHTLYEYRDGIPVIEDARVDIKNVKPRDGQIDIEVIWGALKSISDELGKDNINDLPSYMIAWDDTSAFTANEFKVGYLWFMSISNIDAGNALLQKSAQWILPSVRVDYILDKILERMSTPSSIAATLRTELEQYYIPCLTMSGVQEVPETKKIVLTPYRSDTRFRWGEQPYDRMYMDANYTMGEASYDSVYNMLSLAPNNYFVKLDIHIMFPDAVTGDTLEYRIGYNTGSQIAWVYKHSAYFVGAVAEIKHTGDITIDSTHEKAEIFMQLVWVHSGYATRLNFGNEGNTVQYIGSVTYWKKEGDGAVYGQDFDAILNLPEISQLDFIKDIMSLTGSYTYFRDGIIYFDYIDSVLSENALNIEGWLATKEPETIETEYDGFAQTNYYKYVEDDTIRIDANSQILISDETLETEKEVVKMKLGASDPVFYTIASVPYFTQPADTTKDPTFVSGLKPRILKSRISTAVENTEGHSSRRVGIFDDSMLWSNILTNKYKLVKSILAEPRVIEVEMYLQMADLYKLKTNDLYYFWGSNWIMIDITVSTNGGATGKFIQLN